MRPQQAAKALELLISAKQPVMLHGSPGVGKSQIVKQVAKKLGLELIDLRLSQLDSADLRGIPLVTGTAASKSRKTDWATPKFLPTEGKGILFLDEINSAAQATQAAAYQLVLDRKLGDYELPEGWVVVAAGNRMQDRAIVNQMSSALKNRFSHIDFEVHFEDWIDWAFGANIDDTIIAFLRFRKNFLNESESHSGTTKEEKQRLQNLKDAKAFATPRSWEFFDRILKQEPDEELLPMLAAGTVGDAASVEYMAFKTLYKDLPTAEEILEKPEETRLPKQPSANYAVTTMLARHTTVKNWQQAMKYIERLPGEYQVLFARDIVRNPANSNLCFQPEFMTWVRESKLI